MVIYTLEGRKKTPASEVARTLRAEFNNTLRALHDIKRQIEFVRFLFDVGVAFVAEEIIANKFANIRCTRKNAEQIAQDIIDALEDKGVILAGHGQDIFGFIESLISNDPAAINENPYDFAYDIVIGLRQLGSLTDHKIYLDSLPIKKMSESHEKDNIEVIEKYLNYVKGKGDKLTKDETEKFSDYFKNHPLLVAFNLLIGKDIINIKNPGPKHIDSAERKAETQHEGIYDDLLDLVRARFVLQGFNEYSGGVIISPSHVLYRLSRIMDGLNYIDNKDNNIFIKEWNARPSLWTDAQIIATDTLGMPGEIMLVGASIDKINDITHEIMDYKRQFFDTRSNELHAHLSILENDKLLYNTKNGNYQSYKDIVNTCNALIDRCVNFMDKEIGATIEISHLSVRELLEGDFSEALLSRIDNLSRLMHLEAMKNTSPPWRNHYAEQILLRVIDRGNLDGRMKSEVTLKDVNALRLQPSREKIAFFLEMNINDDLEEFLQHQLEAWDYNKEFPAITENIAEEYANLIRERNRQNLMHYGIGEWNQNVRYNSPSP